MSDDAELEYTPEFIAQLETTWGDGFLSPGGPAEVDEIVSGLPVEGARALDIGIGLGGPAMHLVKAHGVAHVLGVDVEPPVLEAGRERVVAAGLDAKITQQLIEPGPLPFGDGTFDLVFSKDSIVHVPDKPALFAECMRVLKPGGWLAMSDWFRSTEPYTPEMSRYADHGPLKFALAPLGAAHDALFAAGFVEVATRDRHDWFTIQTRRELDWMRGEGYARLLEVLGEAQTKIWIDRSELRVAVAEQGQLRPGHIRGRRPAQSV